MLTRHQDTANYYNQKICALADLMMYVFDRLLLVVTVYGLRLQLGWGLVNRNMLVIALSVALGSIQMDSHFRKR